MKSRSSIRRAVRDNPELFKLPESQLAPIYQGWPLVTVTTDGGCSPNPGLGAWAVVLRMGLNRRELSGLCRDTPTTNNRAEFEAILHGFRALNRPCRVLLRCDSQYCIAILKRPTNSKATKHNLDLIAECREAMKPHKIEFEWVKDHAGDADNMACDMACSAAIRRVANTPSRHYESEPVKSWVY